MVGSSIVSPDDLPCTLGSVSVEPAGWFGTAQWSSIEGSIPLFGIIMLAGVGTGVLFLCSVLAYRQRRSKKYLLVMAAVGALFFRTVIGLGTAMGHVPMLAHHLVEHTLDFLIAALILVAAIRSGPAYSTTDLQGPAAQDDHGKRQ